jgi:hypothetical protein
MPRMDDHQTRSTASWTAALLLAMGFFLLYPLSAGPVLRLYNDDLAPEWSGALFIPLLIVVEHSPEPVQSAFEAYCNFWLSWR